MILKLSQHSADPFYRYVTTSGRFAVDFEHDNANTAVGPTGPWCGPQNEYRSLTVVEEGQIRRLAPLEMLERYNQQVATLVVAAE